MLRAVMDPQTKRIVYKDDGVSGMSPALPMAPNAQPGEVSLPQLSVGPTPAAATVPQTGRAPSMSMAGGMAAPNPLASHLSGLEQANGLPQGYLAQIRAIESANGKNLANPNSSARGPYQFLDKTARAVGLDDDARMDEYKSAAAAAKMAGQDAAAFQSRFGRAPTGADIYGMHQRGRQGYFDLLNGKAPQGDEARLNAAGGMDASGQLGVIQRMYNNAKPDLPGDPTTKFGGGFNGGSALPNTPGTINAVSPVVTQGMGGDSGGGTATPTPSNNPADGKFTGGILGLMQGGDYTGAGANKDFMGKMGDFTGSSAFSAGMKGLMGLMGGGGGGQTVRAPGIQNLPEEDQENKPNMSLLQMMYGKGGVQSGGVGR